MYGWLWHDGLTFSFGLVIRESHEWRIYLSNQVQLKIY
jgi:hypothetical protein